MRLSLIQVSEHVEEGKNATVLTVPKHRDLPRRDASVDLWQTGDRCRRPDPVDFLVQFYPGAFQPL